MSDREKLPALKRFGQNFLNDTTVLSKIISAAELTAHDTVLEIGMGNGILTKALAEAAQSVTTIEIDHKRFEQVAPGLMERYKNLHCIEGDFLELSSKLWGMFTDKVKLIANIPYMITTPIIEDCIRHKEQLERVVLMVQKEVALRLCARPGIKAYGSLTLFVQYSMDVAYIADVPRDCFTPVPKVDSAIICLTPHQRPPVTVSSTELLFKVIRASFWGKRKTLRNCLKQSPYTHYTNTLLDEVTSACGIDLSRRGETLSLEEFARMTDAIFRHFEIAHKKARG